MADAELVCLAVAQVLLGARSGHHGLRLCYGRLGPLFPYLPKQPGCHQRVKAAAPLIGKTMQVLAMLCPSWADERRLLDATPVPCGTSRQTVRRPELARWAGYGYCAAHSRWHWGLKLDLLATAEGMPVAWCRASPELGEREAAQELLERASEDRTLRRGTIVRADKGLAGRDIEGSSRASSESSWRVRTAGTRASAGSAAPAGCGSGSSRFTAPRKTSSALSTTAPAPPKGVHARIAQQLLAPAAAIWHNQTIRTTHQHSLIAYDHRQRNHSSR